MKTAHVRIAVIAGMIFALVLSSCGDTKPKFSDAQILATADAIRRLTPTYVSHDPDYEYGKYLEARELAGREAYNEMMREQAEANATEYTLIATSEARRDATRDAYRDSAEYKDEVRIETTPVPNNGPCLIKGNVGYETKEKIYHVPGQEWYDEAIINSAYGERWFCTEEEAQAAGWRKARN